MGAWGTGLFEEDFACDVKGDFEDFLDEGLSVKKATRLIIKEYDYVLEDDEDTDAATLYLVLASLQMEHGKLQRGIKKKALEIIDKGIGLDLWEEVGGEEFAARKKELSELGDRLRKASTGWF